jgi:hypothetical protein
MLNLLDQLYSDRNQNDTYTPGVPSIVRKFFKGNVGVFYSPCQESDYYRHFFESTVKRISIDESFNRSQVTEPYYRVNSDVFAAVEGDPKESSLFFKMIVNKKRSFMPAITTSILVYNSLLQNVPELNELLLKELEKLKIGNYLLTFYGKHIKVSALPEFFDNLKSIRKRKGCAYFHKANIIKKESFDRNKCVIDHHTLHVHQDWSEINPDGLLSALKTSSQLACLQICNLHGINIYIPEFRKAIEEVGFDEIHFVELKKRILREAYKLTAREITNLSKIEKISFGNFKWIVLMKK